jgi:hypothetical protein
LKSRVQLGEEHKKLFRFVAGDPQEGIAFGHISGSRLVKHYSMTALQKIDRPVWVESDDSRFRKAAFGKKFQQAAGVTDNNQARNGSLGAPGRDANG